MTTNEIENNGSSNPITPDPFPEIPPALLNSADIADYMDAIHLVDPYEPERLRKPASYPLRIGKVVIYWNEAQIRRILKLKEGEQFDLPPNSIVYFTTEERFNLPPYIAARFNLKIPFVHKGLLLGTGPLVDPGFSGPLLIPLHNLTTNTYRLNQGEEIIWVEFTKLSPNKMWDAQVAERSATQRKGAYKEYKKKAGARNDLSAWEYLAEALQNCEKTLVQSSIQDAVINSREAAKQSAMFAKTLSGLGFVALVGILLGLLQLYHSIQATIAQTNQFAGTVSKDVADQAVTVNELKKYHDAETPTVNERMSKLERELSDIQQEVTDLKPPTLRGTKK